MKAFNLSDWALHHRSLVWYLIIVSMAIGAMSYVRLGREEDPNFTIKTMVVSAQWPGASLEDTLSQVTDRLERKIEEIAQLDYTRSITSPGATTIFVNLRDTTRAAEIPMIWNRVRNILSDIRGTLPQGVVGPMFNDDFGDVFGNVYAFTADGLSQRQLRDYVESIRARILTVPNIGKVNLVGTQDEAIFLEFSTRNIAALGLDQQAIIGTLQAQNAIAPSGVIQAGPERISLRVSGAFASEDSLRAINLRINDRFFRLADVATITRGYVDPPTPMFRFNGEAAIGLAIGMRPGANLLEFGEALKAEMRLIEGDLPIGVGVHLVADQPAVVDHAIGGFVKALIEAVVIVLLVSFVSLGMRAGLVVALAIPLVLAITFLAMELWGISLQRISLGALIIALGLLVDDAMIAVEMMVARLEAGDPLSAAATAVYAHTAFPMLTGTLVTVASFIPVGLNSSAAGEFTFTLFVVITVSLIVSWIVAVLFTPLLGVAILPNALKQHAHGPGRFGRSFARLLVTAMRWRWVTIGATIFVFLLSLYGMKFVQQQFFPSSDRPELIVDWTLPQNASITETRAQMDRFEAELRGNADIDYWSSYVGQGAVRFVLSFDVQPSNPFFGQMVIVTRDLEARERVRTQLEAIARRDFIGTDVYVHNMDLGPPVGRPVAYRVSGPDIATVRRLSQELAAIIGRDPRIGSMVYDWNEPARVVRVEVLQDKARQLGVSSQDIAGALNSIVGGSAVTQVRDDIYLINVIGRARGTERGSISTFQDLQLPGQNGRSVPLAAVASFRFDMEQPVVWRRSRLPTITLRAAIAGNQQPATVVAGLQREVDAFGRLPPGYQVQLGGAVEESGKGQAPIAAVVPVMLFVMATILMIQLQSFSRLVLVVAVAPLGLIGVVAALLPSQAPLGFVAILGVLALIGILIRNSVILVVQIDELRREGKPPWDAVIEATEHRMRPILLTAAAASLALIPISREVFWGPMAYAMMGGIIVGTVLTLVFLPALYVAWFRIQEPAASES
ncbi:efflux RND transporter permease subunit [Roseomonas hellenica]|uniref:Efflux RND transporter permease subunit n=1 Tax=Plastoroseomonas hellenica TaxID=2687306 RepID=A0ABS5F5M7_9PROT|nr:efflux RND transporter permease subunit [Plastoroseomonas hellenica]